MAENEENTTGTESAAPPKRFKIHIPVILVALNTLAIMIAGGFAVYSKLLYKKPLPTESEERERLVSLHAQPQAETERALYKIGPITANIAPTPLKPHPDDGTARQLQGKLHYITLSFSLEIREHSTENALDAIRPQFLDGVNRLVGRKSFHDLTTAQGRYILQSELVHLANELLSPHVQRDDEVVNLYFTDFIVQ